MKNVGDLYYIIECMSCVSVCWEGMRRICKVTHTHTQTHRQSRWCARAHFSQSDASNVTSRVLLYNCNKIYSITQTNKSESEANYPSNPTIHSTNFGISSDRSHTATAFTHFECAI